MTTFYEQSAAQLAEAGERVADAEKTVAVLSESRNAAFQEYLRLDHLLEDAKVSYDAAASYRAVCLEKCKKILSEG